TDPEIVRLFGSPLQPPTDRRMQPPQEVMAEVLGLGERFGQRRRILVVTADALTPRMAGPAIRAWQIASALSEEHEVQLATTSSRCEITSPSFTVVAASDEDLRLLEDWCDVIVLQGWILEGRPYLRDSRKVMVVDVYDPLHLEQLEQARDEADSVRRAAVRNATAVLNDQLTRGDFFICASAKQRDFWLGQMSALGRINPLTYDESETLDSLISVVPFGVPDDPPVATRRALKGQVPGIAEDDEVILWGGGIYNWFDPLTLIDAVGRLRERRPKVRLFFMGLKHPNPDVAEMRMAVSARERADDLGLTDTHVFFNESWVPYEERHEYLLDADIGVSTHLDHVETAFSFRTRILDYIWAALPIVATTGDAFAELIEREGVGITVPPEDAEALEEALFRLLDDGEFAAMCRKNLESLRPSFAWSQVLRPLVEFCRSPRRAPDLVDHEMSREFQVAPDSPRRDWAEDLRLAGQYLREGGPALLARRAANRMKRRKSGGGPGLL
ncbi:MAG: glycosyltransferase family 4 protein, partial [Acidimicrobiia bacterium]